MQLLIASRIFKDIKIILIINENRILSLKITKEPVTVIPFKQI